MRGERVEVNGIPDDFISSMAWHRGSIRDLFEHPAWRVWTRGGGVCQLVENRNGSLSGS